jgi:hypothetical protein
MMLGGVPGICGDSDSPASRGPAQWSLAPDLRIGDVDGPIAFSDLVLGKAVPGGPVLFLSWQRPELFMFDRSGNLLRRVGRPGQGPGEFQRPAGLGVTGKLFWVYDAGARRVTFFETATAELASTIQTPVTTLRGRGGFSPVFASPDSVFVGSFSLSSATEAEIPEPLLVFRRGMPDDTLILLPTTHIRLSIRNPERPWAGLHGWQPFSDAPIVASGANDEVIVVERTAEADPHGYRIHWFDVRRKAHRNRFYPTDAAATSRVLVDSLVNLWADRVLAARGPGIRARGEAERRVREELFVPATLPPVSAAFVDDLNRVWIRREAAPAPAVQWDVIAPSGDAIAHVAAAPEYTLVAADSTHAWAMTKDELDVPFIQRLRIVRVRRGRSDASS